MTRRKDHGTYVGERSLDGRRYRVFRVPPGPEAEAVARRTNPRQNSFDLSYMKGRFPMWVRRQGAQPGIEPDDKTVGDSAKRWVDRGRDVSRPVGYNRPRAEEPYVEALAEFFETRIALMPPKVRQVLQDVRDRLKAVMLDTRTFEDQARDLGVTPQAVQQAQARAVEQLVESCGGKLALSEKLRQFLHARDQADGLDRLKYLPRWVHG